MENVWYNQKCTFHFSRRDSPERWMGQSRDEKYDVFVDLNRYNGISNVEYAQMLFENEK